MRAAIAPFPLSRSGQRLFNDLARSQQRRCSLHGDLHHDNVLFDTSRGWLAFDPKGVIGEPAYEMGAVLRNPTENPERFAVRAILETRAQIASDRRGLDCKRVLAWAFAQAVLSAVWSLEDGQDPERGLATAAAVLPLL